MRIDTRAGYADFLRAQARVLLPLEAQMERAGVERVLPDWELRRRSDALRRDLESLKTPSFPAVVPSLQSGSELLGAAYVLEGSRLGARVMRSRVVQGLPTAFLDHGEGLRLWQSFLPVLESNADVRRDPDAAAAAAKAVFGLFEEAMTPRQLVAAE